MRFAKGIVASGLALGALAFGTAAHAQLTSFAEFGSINTTQGGPGPATPQPSIFFTNTGATSTLSVVTGTNYRFLFDVNNSYDNGAGNNIRASVSMSATVNGVATTAGSTITQNLQNITITYTAVTPIATSQGPKSNLLTVTFLSGFLTGISGSGGMTFNSGTPTSSGSTLTGFSSDFLDFSGVTTETFSLALTAVNNTSPAGTGPTVNGNGYLDSFGASFTGIYSSDPPPPYQPLPATPGSASAMIGIAMAGMQFGMVRLRRRRKSKVAAA